MNFLRRPSLPAFLVTAHAQNAKKDLKRKQSMQERLLGNMNAPDSDIDKMFEKLVTQLGLTDESVQDALAASLEFQSDMERMASSATKFASTLGKLAEQEGALLTTSDLYPEREKKQGDTEQQKALMMMAATHQLAKWYALFGQNCMKAAKSLKTEFHDSVQSRHEVHQEKTEQWLDEFERTVYPLSDEIERKKRTVARMNAADPEQRAMFAEISSSISQTEQLMRLRMRGVIRAERHHNVHFTHRLQQSFKSHLDLMTSVADECVEDVDDMTDVSRIKTILNRHYRPSELYLRIRRDSEEDQTPALPTAEMEVPMELKMISPADSGIAHYTQPEVPQSPLEPAAAITALYAQTNGSEGNVSMQESKQLVRSLVKSKSIAIRAAKVWYEYEGTNENDLTVSSGDDVHVVSVEGEWAYCVKGDMVELKDITVGWLPHGYIEFS